MIKLDEINKCLINLPERTDRYTESMDEISTFFENHSVNFHKGIKETPIYKGIAQAHMNCVAMAKNKRWENVLIIEDDVCFQSKLSRQYAENAFNNLPDDYDVLLSSVYLSKGLTKYNEHWSLTREFCGLTFYVVSQRAYDKILGFDKSMHIDRAMATLLGLKCYVVNSFFAIQRSDYSDNAGKKVDYNHLLKKFNVLK